MAEQWTGSDSSVWKNSSKEIAADKIAQDNTSVSGEDVCCIFFEESNRNCLTIECIYQAMRESTENEEWNSEQQWKKITLACESDCCSHDETATDSKYT